MEPSRETIQPSKDEEKTVAAHLEVFDDLDYNVFSHQKWSEGRSPFETRFSLGSTSVPPSRARSSRRTGPRASQKAHSRPGILPHFRAEDGRAPRPYPIGQATARSCPVRRRMTGLRKYGAGRGGERAGASAGSPRLLAKRGALRSSLTKATSTRHPSHRGHWLSNSSHGASASPAGATCARPGGSCGWRRAAPRAPRSRRQPHAPRLSLLCEQPGHVVLRLALREVHVGDVARGGEQQRARPAAAGEAPCDPRRECATPRRHIRWRSLVTGIE